MHATAKTMVQMVNLHQLQFNSFIS